MTHRIKKILENKRVIKRRANGTGNEAMSDDEAFDGFGDDGGESGE